MTKSNRYTISPAQASTKFYKQALKTELGAGAASSVADLSQLRINHPDILAYKGRILGGRTKVDKYPDWTEFLVSEFGSRTHCLSLGSGLGRVEKYLVERGFTSRMETIELCAGVNEKLRLEDDRISVRQGDLNFVELPKGAYDFILCHGILHHLINLEHVLEQVNHALKPDGILLIYEYVGENRWQFSRDRLEGLRRMFPAERFRPPERWKVGGFESVRSEELPRLIKAQFGQSCIKAVWYGGIYFPFVTCTTRAADVHMGRVVELDEKASREGSLPPCYHMGLYRRSNSLGAEPRPWSDQEVRERLDLATPLWARCWAAVRDTPGGRAIRMGKKVLSKRSYSWAESQRALQTTEQ